MAYQISQDKLEIDGHSVPFVKAHSYGGRFHPTLIVCHDTADRPVPRDTVNWFASSECHVSAHVVVERDGSITQMVPFDRKAWHAGKSCWEGQTGCNNFAIGIEIDNPGKLDKNGNAWFTRRSEAGITGIQHAKTKEHGDGYWLPYTPEQIASVTELCRALVAEYPTIKAIGTHWLVSPGRKVDTNPLFPLEALRASVFKKRGAPGRPAAFPKLELGDQGKEVAGAQAKLKDLGYPIGAADGIFGPQMRVAVLAFEAENNLVYDGALSSDEHKMLMTEPDVKSMPVGARAELTEKDLIDRGSRTVTWTQRGKKLILGIPILGTVLGGSDTVANDSAGVNAALQQLEQTRQQATEVSSLFGWVLTPTGLAVAGVIVLLAAIYFILDRIAKRRVADARSGANMAR